MNKSLFRKDYLTDNVSTSTLRRWTLNEFKSYMCFALFMTLIPLPSQLKTVITLANIDEAIFFFLIDLIGCIFLFYRLFCVFILIYRRKSLTPERVEYTINVVWFGFWFFLIKALMVIILPDFVLDTFIFPISFEENKYLVSAIYILIDSILTAPDLYILYKLQFYLIYNFDGDNAYDDLDDFTTDILIFRQSSISLGSNGNGIDSKKKSISNTSNNNPITLSDDYKI